MIAMVDDPRLVPFALVLALLGSCDVAGDGDGALASRTAPVEPQTNGRIERFEELRIVRVWGTPAQRGHALGRLLGEEIVALVRAEFDYRFGKAPQRLEAIRRMLPRLIAWPDDLHAEIVAMAAAIERTVPDRALEGFGRPLDRTDLLVVNALDVFGTFGCSGFTAWGDDVEGGGVLSARNFDWPYSGPHMVDNAIVLVEHGERAVASVTWPGYLGAVTAVNEDGLAVFLHVGNGGFSPTPEAESWPTAVAARAILERATPAGAAALARELLEKTSPPSSFITRVVAPQVDAGAAPARVFEVDARSVVERPVHEACVITNHFVREGLRASRDSQQRFTTLTEDVDGLRREGDRRISVAEAWQALARVERGGQRPGFGTLHSLVFRAQPWVFELALGRDAKAGRVQAAPSKGRRYAIPREVLFRDPRGAQPR
jgi:hypothetical protein